MNIRTNMTTLCYIENNGEYLMLHRNKKEKDINKGKWIGIGGHFNLNESPEECLFREVMEETEIELESWRLRGVITFKTESMDCEYMYLYTAACSEKKLIDCDEGELKWIKKEDIPKLNMWSGDYIFFDLIKKDLPFFSLKITYNGDELVEAVLNGKEKLI